MGRLADQLAQMPQVQTGNRHSPDIMDVRLGDFLCGVMFIFAWGGTVYAINHWLLGIW